MNTISANLLASSILPIFWVAHIANTWVVRIRQALWLITRNTAYVFICAIKNRSNTSINFHAVSCHRSCITKAKHTDIAINIMFITIRTLRYTLSSFCVQKRSFSTTFWINTLVAPACWSVKESIVNHGVTGSTHSILIASIAILGARNTLHCYIIWIISGIAVRSAGLTIINRQRSAQRAKGKSNRYISHSILFRESRRGYWRKLGAIAIRVKLEIIIETWSWSPKTNCSNRVKDDSS